MSKLGNGMQAYSEALTAMTAVGLGCGSAILSIIFAKSAIAEGSAKDAGIAVSTAFLAIGSGVSAYRSAKNMARMARGDVETEKSASPPIQSESPQDP